MPVVPNQRMRRRLGRLAALTVAVMFTIPAAAFASSCPAQATTTPFTQWGDSGSYFPLPGGNFESPLATTGWTVKSAEITGGNEPFYVGGSSDANSLTINGGGTAVSPAFCIDDTMQNLRFFAHSLGAAGSLDVRLVVHTEGAPVTIPLGQVTDLAASSMSNWAPTGQLSLFGVTKIPSGHSALGRLEFSATGPSSWQMDDLYVDPYRYG